MYLSGCFSSKIGRLALWQNSAETEDSGLHYLACLSKLQSAATQAANQPQSDSGPTATQAAIQTQLDCGPTATQAAVSRNPIKNN